MSENCLPLPLGRRGAEPDGVLAEGTDSPIPPLAGKAAPCGGEKGEEPWDPPERTISCPSIPPPNPIRLSLEEPEKIWWKRETLRADDWLTDTPRDSPCMLYGSPFPSSSRIPLVE